MKKTLVIAEPGCTHQGDLATMLRLIDTAAVAGADVYKNQWTSSAQRMVERRHAPDYLPFYRWLQYPLDWHAVCAKRCEDLGLRYACSVYLAPDAGAVAPFVSMLKVSSFEAKDSKVLEECIEQWLPVVVSVGMLGEDEADEIAIFMRGYGQELSVLQCTSTYPVSPVAIHLNVIRRNRWQGLSDHSRNVLTGAVAVGAGAEIIEAHFRLDDTDPQNPDYPVAFTPWGFAEYIKNIRLAEVLMGTGEKRIQPCEEPLLRHRVTG